MARAFAPLLALLLVAAALAACGGDDGGGAQEGGDDAAATTEAVDERIAVAQDVSEDDFPPVEGRTLQEIADTMQAGPTIGLATNEYAVGENRFAFGLIDDDQRFIYGPSAVYIARAPDRRARGPFPAPADSLLTKPAFRSQNAAAEDGAIAAIYHTELPLDEPGRYAVLAVTELDGELYGAPAEITVKRRSAIPEPGDEAPVVATDTLASASGDIESIDTRVPPSDMHERSFDEVVGEKPVALLFSSPRLCPSRVCGPVTDIAAQLKDEYGDEVEFIHQEAYVDNEVKKGFREPLRAFDLRSEPWLFAVDADGRVAARLEGSFGIDEFRAAVDAARDGAQAPPSD